MHHETLAIKGREVRVHKNADGLPSELINLYARQISESTTGKYLQTLSPADVERLITLGMSTLIVDATNNTLLAHASRTPTTRRRKPASLIGAWVSYAPGFGTEAMKLAATDTDNAIAKVHILNRGAHKTIRRIGRIVGIEKSPTTGNVVLVYKISPKRKS